MAGKSTKTRVLAMRVPNDLYADWEAAAQLAGVPLSEYMLALVKAGDRGTVREILAGWMLANGFVTGHGDTIEDLLGELSAQIEDLRDSLIVLKDLAQEQATQVTIKPVARPAAPVGALLKTPKKGKP